MTAGKIAAIAVATTLGVGGVSAILGVSGYNKSEYGRFTPYISTREKKWINNGAKLAEKNFYKSNNLNKEAMSPEVTKEIDKFVRKSYLIRLSCEEKIEKIQKDLVKDLQGIEKKKQA